ncbi:MAG: hypothetical protein ACTHX2_00690 [Microbacterium sp.]
MANEETQQSPWTRPSFLVAGALVMLLVIAGVVLSIIFTLGGNDDADSNPSKPATTAAPAPDEGVESGSSVCGLDGDVLEEARLSKAPTADEWLYRGTTAYPVSNEYGPGETDSSGFKYCFQRSPEGAVFAAASAVAAQETPQATAAWIDYFLAPGAYRDQLLADGPSLDTDTSSSQTDTRMQIAGFRLLAYDGESARVDIATEVSSSSGTGTASIVYELVWSEGDWKSSTDSAEPISVVPLKNLAGYIAWRE